MIERRRRWLLLMCLIICILVLSSCGIEDSLRAYFPMWDRDMLARNPNFLPQEDPYAKLELKGTDTDAYISKLTGLHYDELQIDYTNASNEVRCNSDAFWVQYKFANEWYTVYVDDYSTMECQVVPPGAKLHLRYLVPAGLFSIPGEYRLYKKGAGYCYISIDSKMKN